MTPTPAVLTNSLSPAPRCTTLVSPVTIGTPAARAARAMEPRDPAQQCRSSQALLDDHGAGEIERPRAADREVVDRAVDRQRADVAAGKEQRIDHEGVGGEGEPVAARASAGEVEARLVFQRREQRIVEGRDEDVVDQVAASPCRRRHGPA